MHKKIHNLIKSNNIKQRQIAQKMGISTAHLQMYLLGNRRITLAMMNKMTETLCLIADDNIGKSMVLKKELQELLMNMCKSNSISDM